MSTDLEIESHSLVPKHFLMKDDEAKDMLVRLNISLNQLPKISKNDPAIKGLDAKPGNVIKIGRKSGTAKTSVYYRAVHD